MEICWVYNFGTPTLQGSRHERDKLIYMKDTKSSLFLALTNCSAISEYTGYQARREDLLNTGSM